MKNFKDVTLRQRISHRGGGIEISLDSFGYVGEKMTAYQNYLGGGVLGAIANDCTIIGFKDNEELLGIAYQLSRYFHTLTNPEGEGMSFEDRQKLPLRAY